VFLFLIVVSVITVWGSKTALIFFNSILFVGNFNLVGDFGRSNFKIPNSFQKPLENNIKIKKNGNSILVFGVTLK